MKQVFCVFTVIMCQTFLALAWHKLSSDAYVIFLYGCLLADVSAVVTYYLFGGEK